MNDLKRALSSLSAVSSPLSPTQKSRQLTLAPSLGILLKDFPELGTPGSPADYAPASPSTDYFVTPKSAPAFFYIPPRMVEVFARLTVRAGEAGLGPKTRDLVEKCRVIWGIESCREKEKEVEGLIARWSDTIGTREELEWGINVADGVKDLSVSLPKNGPLPPVLESLLGNLLALLSTSISSIFPSTSVPPSPPPPSILPILNAAPGLFLTAPRAVKTISKLSDELTASAIGEYVAAMGSMMGGVGQDGEGARKIGESGKDQMVEGFEKVAVWMDKEVSNVRKVWGNALGA